MPNRTSAELRARAAEARRISGNTLSPQAQRELLEMADALEAEADRLESREAPNEMPPPPNGA